uniref:Baseplate assembly protein n=1 Tax=Aliivibrio phage vB_Alvi_H905 TaxID=3234039 RepID=A0AB39CA16_9VIRU
MSQGINLELLPPLTLVDQVPMDEIVADIAEKAALENAAPSDPSYRSALAYAYREMYFRQDSNEQAKGVMLAFAKGAQLDHIGSTYYRTPLGSPVVRLDSENDVSYKTRLQLSPEGYSVAGPEGAYRFFGLSADSDIRFLKPISPRPAVMSLYLLTYSNGGVATDELCRKVENYVWPYRPMGDRVTAYPAELIRYTVTAELLVEKGSDLSAIQTKALEETAFYTLNENKFGGYVSDSGLKDAMTVGNVKKVNLIGWSDKVAEVHQVPLCDGITITVREV